MKLLLTAAAACAALSTPHVLAQTPCRGSNLAGTVRDSTLALIPGATLTLDTTRTETSAADGRFQFACVPDGTHTLTITSPGFAARTLSYTAPVPARLDLLLQPEAVETSIDVAGADDTPSNSASAAGPTQTIAGARLQSLADDPDDLLRELQQLAAATGGNAAGVTIAVDGFQGSSALPPKSSIAYIKVNPDQYAAEYREPPFDGARVEVYTKPGQKTFHGALFLTNGSPWENARDPFASSKAAIGKQRYGFEFTGPVRRTGSDFALTLEHRAIDNFAVVNAFTLTPAGAVTPFSANFATPQRLWLGTARLDWQLGPRNTFLTTYSANINQLQNLGVGGTSLAEAGYGSNQYEHMLRFSDITTLSPRLMHEARLSLRWDGNTNSPASSAPQVQVAGAFTGGGSTLGPQRIRELNTEFNDDAILTPHNHIIKSGLQMMIYNEHQRLTTNFNGSYTFGGGPAPALDASGHAVPGQTSTISGIEQYRRAQLNLPGGTPTAYTAVTGSPIVDFTVTTAALFFEDDWNVGHGVHIAYGVRYYLQNNPTILNAATPRLGILWSPTKKGTWTVHAHAGMFSGRFGPGNNAEIRREDGVSRITSLIYNPVFADPFAAATPIHTLRQYAPHIGDLTWQAENVGGTRTLPGGWNLSIDYYLGRFWNDTRSVNINSPLNGSPTGPRPGPANVNILQVQNSAQGRVNATFVGIEQHSLKRVQLYVGAVRVILLEDSDNNPFFTPQSSSSDVGELAFRSGQNRWNVFGNATFTLPRKLQLSANFNGGGGAHYNITTGFDNNGDGNFNDRPQYASPGTPGAVSTRYGILVASGGTGVFPRNKGLMPWNLYLDANLQRAFALTRNAKPDHPQTLTLNLRSSNLLNHLNVTQIGSVLGSPLFDIPYAADPGRRIEAGARYTF